MQKMYELQKSENGLLEPTELIEEVGRLIDNFSFASPNFIQNGLVIFDKKEIVPKKQFMALYAINKIATVINSKHESRNQNQEN